MHSGRPFDLKRITTAWGDYEIPEAIRPRLNAGLNHRNKRSVFKRNRAGRAFQRYIRLVEREMWRRWKIKVDGHLE